MIEDVTRFLFLLYEKRSSLSQVPTDELLTRVNSEVHANLTNIQISSVLNFIRQIPSTDEILRLVEREVETLGLDDLVTHEINLSRIIDIGAESKEIASDLIAGIITEHKVTYNSNGSSIDTIATLNFGLYDNKNYIWLANLDYTKDQIMARFELVNQGYLVASVLNVETAKRLGRKLNELKNIRGYRVMNEREFKLGTQNEYDDGIVPILMTPELDSVYPDFPIYVSPHQQSLMESINNRELDNQGYLVLAFKNMSSAIKIAEDLKRDGIIMGCRVMTHYGIQSNTIKNHPLDDDASNYILRIDDNVIPPFLRKSLDIFFSSPVINMEPQEKLLQRAYP